MKAIVSIHDVEPNTLDRVLGIIDNLPPPCRQHLILLIIPGLAWSPSQLRKLKALQDEGYILAGHGWTHKCKRIHRIYHRLHSIFVSRDVAEHLALSEQEIIDLLKRNHAWFAQHDLNPPDYYVPPAWAMGTISKRALQQSPFNYFETSFGIYHTTDDIFHRLPLIGFEADTNLRKHILNLWNFINGKTTTAQRPLRISIHPNDPNLKLQEKLWQSLADVEATVHYHKLAERNAEQ